MYTDIMTVPAMHEKRHDAKRDRKLQWQTAEISGSGAPSEQQRFLMIKKLIPSFVVSCWKSRRSRACLLTLFHWCTRLAWFGCAFVGLFGLCTSFLVASGVGNALAVRWLEAVPSKKRHRNVDLESWLALRHSGSKVRGSWLAISVLYMLSFF